MISGLLSALLLLSPTAAAPAERAVSIPAAGDVRLAGTLTLPAGSGPFPAAVLVGGFGPSDRDGALAGRGEGAYRDIAAGLTARGVAVLRYDKRGIGRSGGAPLSWLDRRPLAADAATVTRFLAAMPGIDRRRITLVGHSQGGDLALEAARRSPATRVVTLAAPGRPLRLLPRVSGVADRFLTRLVGADVSRATLGRDPVADAVRVRAPVLMVQGTADRTVPPADMARLARARRAAGLPTHTLPLPGASHFLQVQGRIPSRALDVVAAFAG